MIAALIVGGTVFYFHPFDPRSSELCDAVYAIIQESFDESTVAPVVPQLKRMVDTYERDHALDTRRAARVYKMLAEYEASTDDLVLGDRYAKTFMENKSVTDIDPSFAGIYAEYRADSLIRQRRADEALAVISPVVRRLCVQLNRKVALTSIDKEETAKAVSSLSLVQCNQLAFCAQA